MNHVEIKIYDKYVHTKLSYIFIVYEEFERRVHCNLEKHDDLKTGECKFDYLTWEKRLNLSHWQLINAIKNLINDNVIKQISKGTKGTSSVYFLNRFNDQQNKSSKIQGLPGINQQNNHQNIPQSNLLSTKSKSSVYSEIVDYLNKKAGTNYKSTIKKTQLLINARFKEGFTLKNFKTVIDIKVGEWLNDDKTSNFLKPEILFGSKFKNYLEQQLSLLTQIEMLV